MKIRRGIDKLDWEQYFNIADLPQGNYRSIGGYAAESLAIARAMQCGYNLFFKAWRDSPYDGVLDYGGTLFRIEIKGTTTNSLSVTSGGRSGAQIDREAEDREHIIDRNSVDFLIGVNNLNGDCYIIHSEILEIFRRKSLSLEKIELFKEGWKIFKGYSAFSPEVIKQGFLQREIPDLVKVAFSLNIHIDLSLSSYTIGWKGFKGGNLENLAIEQYLTLQIWRQIYTATTF